MGRGRYVLSDPDCVFVQGTVGRTDPKYDFSSLKITIHPIYLPFILRKNWLGGLIGFRSRFPKGYSWELDLHERGITYGMGAGLGRLKG